MCSIIFESIVLLSYLCIQIYFPIVKHSQIWLQCSKTVRIYWPYCRCSEKSDGRRKRYISVLEQWKWKISSPISVKHFLYLIFSTINVKKFDDFFDFKMCCHLMRQWACPSVLIWDFVLGPGSCKRLREAVHVTLECKHNVRIQICFVKTP